MIKGDNSDNAISPNWVYPPLSLLKDEENTDGRKVKKTVSTIEKVLKSKDIKARVEEINVGPTVIQYLIKATNNNVKEIDSQKKLLAEKLGVINDLIRICDEKERGKNFIGIEIANDQLIPACLKSILASETMYTEKNRLAIGLGRDISGNVIKLNLLKAKYTLITGISGSGRNSFLRMISSTLLFRTTPNAVRLLIFDPNRQLSGFKNIPYLLSPITDNPDYFVS